MFVTSIVEKKYFIHFTKQLLIEDVIAIKGYVWSNLVLAEDASGRQFPSTFTFYWLNRNKDICEGNECLWID